MVELSLTDDHLHLEVKGMDKLWAFKSQLDIRFHHIRDVRHDPEAASGCWHGIKMPGTSIPGDHRGDLLPAQWAVSLLGCPPPGKFDHHRTPR
jgi:hypothetical protein